MKAFQHILTITLFSLPSITFAATASLQNLLKNIPEFINKELIPFLIGIAFLTLIYNVVRYFVVEGGNENARENAKNIALYSTFAFVFLIIFAGIVNMLVDSSGLQTNKAPCPDYNKNYGKNCD